MAFPPQQTQPPPPPGGPGASGAPGAPAGPDPSMEDILASIRRILNEDEPAADALSGAAPRPAPEAAPPVNAAPASGVPPAHPASPEADDVLVLDASMMVEPPSSPNPESSPPRTDAPAGAASPAPERIAAATSPLVAPEAAAGVASSLGSLVRTLASERTTSVRRDGPTIEDLVREELRPLVKDWLDRHLPPLVERLVRAEIERVVGRAVP